MKKIILAFLILASNLAVAQNDLKASLQFEEAEKSFADNNFEEAYAKLEKAQMLLANWSSNISYLKIICLDALCDYDNYTSSYTQLLSKEAPLYMKFANEYKDAVVMDKFKEVNAIEEKIKIAAQIEKDKKSPEFLILQTNKSEDIEQYKNLANKGNAHVMVQVGDMYNYGTGVAIDKVEAMNWYTKAADKNNLHAMVYVAYMYVFVEDGINKDYTQAIFWLKKAAEKGSTWAMNQLADCYKEDEVADYNQSMIWYKKLLVKGEDVFFNIGSFYERGKGVTKDYKEAFNWYNKGLEKALKTKQSENRIGFYYYLIANLYHEGGFGILQNYEEAIKLYKLAADKGLDLAMEELSEMYSEGEGVEKDEKIAKEWSDKALQARK